MVSDFNLSNINVSDLIDKIVIINGVGYKIINIDDSDTVDVILYLKDSKNKKHSLTIERITFKFLRDYGETQTYYYNLDGVYDNEILTIKKV